MLVILIHLQRFCVIFITVFAECVLLFVYCVISEFMADKFNDQYYTACSPLIQTHKLSLPLQ